MVRHTKGLSLSQVIVQYRWSWEVNICSTQSFRDPGSLRPWVFHPLGSQSSPLNVWGKKHERSHSKSTRGRAGKVCLSLLSIFHGPDLSHGSISLLGEAHWLKLPTRPAAIVTICLDGFTAGGPGKEQRTNKPPPTGRVWERSKGDTTGLTISQNPSQWHPSWLSNACFTRKDSESEWLAKDNPETNPITIKPETVSHVAEQFSWVPLPCCSSPGCCFPIKSLALSACISLDNAFLSVRQEPTLGALEGAPLQHISAGDIGKYTLALVPSEKEVEFGELVALLSQPPSQMARSSR